MRRHARLGLLLRATRYLKSAAERRLRLSRTSDDWLVVARRVPRCVVCVCRVSREWHAKSVNDSHLTRVVHRSGGLWSMSRCNTPVERCSEMVRAREHSTYAFVCRERPRQDASFLLSPDDWATWPRDHFGATEFRRQYGTAGRYSGGRPNLPILSFNVPTRSIRCRQRCFFPCFRPLTL